MCCQQIWGWIALAIWENASGIQGKVFAVLYKMLFAAALYMLYSPINSEATQQLRMQSFNDKFGKTVDEVQAYKLLVLVICFFGFTLLLGITYWVIKWDKRVAFMRSFFSQAQFNVWVAHVRWFPILSTIHACVKSYLLPCIWPFFCSFVGIQGNIFTLALLHLSYLAFVSMHRYVKGFRVTNTMVSIAVFIIHSPLGYESENSIYLVLLAVVLPLCTRCGFELVLNWEDDVAPTLADRQFMIRDWEA